MRWPSRKTPNTAGADQGPSHQCRCESAAQRSSDDPRPLIAGCCLCCLPFGRCHRCCRLFCPVAGGQWCDPSYECASKHMMVLIMQGARYFPRQGGRRLLLGATKAPHPPPPPLPPPPPRRCCIVALPAASLAEVTLRTKVSSFADMRQQMLALDCRTAFFTLPFGLIHALSSLTLYSPRHIAAASPPPAPALRRDQYARRVGVTELNFPWPGTGETKGEGGETKRRGEEKRMGRERGW